MFSVSIVLVVKAVVLLRVGSHTCDIVGLGAGLAVGAVAEAAKRGLGLANSSDASRLLLLGKVSRVLEGMFSLFL